MRFDILTIFPDFFESPLKQSILGKAIEKGLVEIGIHNIRDFAASPFIPLHEGDRGRRTTDDSPYGGGDGMVMKAEPIVMAVESVKAGFNPDAKVVLTTPQGKKFNQQMAAEFAASNGLVIICGRYEGVDERVKELVVDMEVSVGDYILSGGEAPAMIIIDAVSRLVPGVLGSDESAKDDSFSYGLLEYPQYTRPESFRGLNVPEVLLSGNHQEIKTWRRLESLKRTAEKRPDLLEKILLTEEEKRQLGIKN
ncbi:MAG: tRNA (guanosine(37)-N1)-methyltransferase TrmD [Deltaproteobacteria bacterium]|nr:tRNA (guanosine(37)-N1)-methyltransferase TrmD [Deltaproteobacteria bacterium]